MRPASASARRRPAPSRSCAPSAMPERAGQGRRRQCASWRPAGSPTVSLVEAMHQARVLALGVAQRFEHPIDMFGHARTALHGKAGRLVQHQHVVVLDRASSPSAHRGSSAAASDSSAVDGFFGASSFSGGMRTPCPSSSRSLLSARLPSTRSSPFRTMRWIWENDRPGNRASRNRSTR